MSRSMVVLTAIGLTLLTAAAVWLGFRDGEPGPRTAAELGGFAHEVVVPSDPATSSGLRRSATT